jgi:ATP-dependent helicase YprA (DUF1998 family)
VVRAVSDSGKDDAGNVQTPRPEWKGAGSPCTWQSFVLAAIRNAEELQELWASPKTKDALRRQDVCAELVIADEVNTRALEQHLLEADVDEPLQLAAPREGPREKGTNARIEREGQVSDTSALQMTGTRKGDGSRFVLRVNLKRLREQEALTETDCQASENRQTCEGARILSGRDCRDELEPWRRIGEARDCSGLGGSQVRPSRDITDYE